MNPDITDTLLIAAIGVAGGAGLIFIQVLVQWSLRKKHPAPAELPYAMVEEIAPRVEAPPPPKLEAPTEVVAKPPPTPEPVLPPPAVEAPAPPTPSAPKAPPRLGLGLRKTRESFLARIRTALSGTAKLSEIYEGLEEALIGADVGVDTSLKLTESLRGKLKNESRPDTVREALKSEISAILEKAERPMADSGDAPLVIMLVGVNGVGKTTTIAKLAARYKESRGTVLVAAADTFRAAAIEQLEVWCNRAGVEIIKQKQGSDPAAVAFDAVKAAVARKAGVVLIDTAGRLQTKSNLMEELKKIGRVAERALGRPPDEVLLVLDATLGQNAVQQATSFTQAVPVTGIVLTKMDGTARGGVILTVKDELKVPIKFVGTGEKADDFDVFRPREFAEALFAAP